MMMMMMTMMMMRRRRRIIMSPERGHTFCASRHSRNACQDFTRATLYGNLRGKCRAPEWAQNADKHFVRACAVESHVKISQEPLYTEIYGENAAPQNEPRTQTNILCEPAQSNRMSRFHKSHFIRKFTGKMPRPRMSPERRQTFCASLRSRIACQDFTRATLYGNLRGKCRAPEWAQNADKHFVRACAVESHVKISQEPLYTEIYGENAAPQNEPRTQTNILCEPAQSNRMSRFHKSHFIRKFTGKMPRPRMSPERRQTFCASLRSRIACQDFTRATLYGNLRGKCRAPEWAQNADKHFVRACAVESHVKISQEPLYTEIYGQNAAPQNEPRTQTNILCEPAQSNRMSRFHKSHFIRKFTGKLPRPRVGTLRSSTGLYTYRKNSMLFGEQSPRCL